MTHPPLPLASSGSPTAQRRGRARVRHDLAVRRLTVTAVTDLTPRLRRVTVGGAELAGFRSDGPSDHLKVFFADPLTGRLAVPTVTPDGIRPPAEGRVVARDYTPVNPTVDDRGGSLDLDFVLHGDDGPASAWADAARIGDTVTIAGPRGSKLVPEGWDRVLLGADETALPSVRRWLELLPPRTTVDVLAEVADAADEAYLADLPGLRPGGVTVTWLHRDGAAPGTTTLLEQAVRASTIDADTFVWCGGEATSLVPLRRYLRRELGLPKAQAEVAGYWRRGVADFDHHAPLDPGDPD